MTQTAARSGIAGVNGTNIAYRVQGEGPPLVLIMGYRLNSTAWPDKFVETLARDFTVITLDNRGTGRSDKPVKGYAIANMACDVAALLDAIDVDDIYLLGYSMGGAIAQEFVRQFPERVRGLVLCATMCGGPRATYADASVVRVMRDLDGLSPEQIARRIWQVTYAPGYLQKHHAAAEDQMRRETALPTPLHAADLQFQAFAEFDGARALAQIRCPTLVLTGDLDQLIRPQNSEMMAKLIPGAKLVVISGGGHRVLWEAVDDCIDLITDFFSAIGARPAAAPREMGDTTVPHAFASATELFTALPIAMTRAGYESLTVARQSLLFGGASRFGDGKPIIIVAPRFVGSDLLLLPLSMWLKALGYRPVTTRLSHPADTSSDLTLAQAIHDVTRRVGRKAVLVTHAVGMARALRVAEDNRGRISDIVVLESALAPDVSGIRSHAILSGWPLLPGAMELPRLLRNIAIELIEEQDPNRLGTTS